MAAHYVIHQTPLYFGADWEALGAEGSLANGFSSLDGLWTYMGVCFKDVLLVGRRPLSVFKFGADDVHQRLQV